MPDYTSPLAASLVEDLLARFDRYVRIDTQAARDRTQYPSTPGQLELAALLAEELLEIGLSERPSTRAATWSRRYRLRGAAIRRPSSA